MIMQDKEFVNGVPGKIILSGEYAVVFGKQGIAVPSKERMTVTLGEAWNVSSAWTDYASNILKLLKTNMETLSIETDLPLGKGMGSSTTLVIAICRAILGPNCREKALEIENAVNSGHSGLDFAVIWNEAPTLFEKGKEPETIKLPKNLLDRARLIDTGAPNERTPELIAWVKSRQAELQPYIDAIGACTVRLLQGESLKTVMRDHHRAQVALGVVPAEAQKIIEDIERGGGAAKVIGAGGRTGGGGMVLALP